MSSDSFEMVGVSLQSYSPPPASSASFQESRLWFRLSCHVRPGRAGPGLHVCCICRMPELNNNSGTHETPSHSPPCRHCQSSPGLAGKTRSSFADNDAYALAIMMGLIETTTTRLDMHDLVRPPSSFPSPYSYCCCCCCCSFNLLPAACLPRGYKPTPARHPLHLLSLFSPLLVSFFISQIANKSTGQSPYTPCAV